MISTDNCYYHNCMTGFTNLYRSFVNDSYKKEKKQLKDEKKTPENGSLGSFE